ncbi:MAG: 7-cyano-7-deazaguanine synthase [Pyrinomonadaceae bacterium]
MTPNEYSFDFSLAGNVSGGLQQKAALSDMPAFAEYYVDDERLAIPFGNSLPPLLADWIDVAVASYFADRFAVRRTRLGGKRQQYHWGRVVKLRVGLRAPEIWRREEVSQCLSDLLGFITGDKWQFEFVEYRGDPRPSEVNVQATLFPLTGPTRVALYSGGLDSFAAVAQEMWANQAQQFVLVSGVTNSRQQAGQRRQVRAIEEFVGRAPIHVTVPLRRSWREVQLPEEWSQRGRGFLFLTLGGATSLAINNHELFVFENGIGAINLPINGTQVGTYSSRAVNPITLARMEAFIQVLTGKNFTIHNPFLFRTKGEMCSNEAVVSLASLVSETFSCDGFPVRAHGCPQCGTCSSCILRRISLLHANLLEHDRGYLVDVFDEAKTLNRDQQYVLRAMYWQARRISECLGNVDAWQAMTRVFPMLIRIEDVLATRGDQNRHLIQSSLLRLYQQYIDEWNQFQSRCSLFLRVDVRVA